MLQRELKSCEGLEGDGEGFDVVKAAILTEWVVSEETSVMSGSSTLTSLGKRIPDRRTCNYKALRQKHNRCDSVTERELQEQGEGGRDWQEMQQPGGSCMHTGGTRGKSKCRPVMTCLNTYIINQVTYSLGKYVLASFLPLHNPQETKFTGRILGLMIPDW